jgi:Fe2+/Zn2+ uptake regulation proteins
MDTQRKKSKKRDAIIALLKSTKSHPNAEWIYATLKPEFPALSLGTVYRNLTQFKEDGVITSVANVGGQERYDTDTNEHAHFICDCCGCVIDVEASIPLGKFALSALEETGAVITGVKLKFHGLCGECAKK